jgi:hypothetical protein
MRFSQVSFKFYRESAAIWSATLISTRTEDGEMTINKIAA